MAPAIIYIIITLIISIYLTLTSGSSNRFVTFIIVYWILAGCVLGRDYFIIDMGIFFDLQPERVIFLIFTFYLVLRWCIRWRFPIQNRSENQNRQIYLYELALYLYFFIYILSASTHLGYVLTTREIFASLTRLLAFPIIYLILKMTADAPMIRTIYRALLILCVLTTFVGIIQFATNSDFLRYGAEFKAFAGFKRSNGIFFAEYFQAYFLLVGIIISLVIIQSTVRKIIMAAFFSAGIVLTFHRMAWIITILSVILYCLKLTNIKKWKIVVAIFLIGIITYVSNIIPTAWESLAETPFVQERLLSSTAIDRFAYYNIAIEKIPDHFLFGIGSLHSDIYFRSIKSAGGTIEEASGELGGIHNLYIMVAFIQGVPAALALLLFVILSLLFFYRYMNVENKYYYIPVATASLFFLANMSNSFPLDCTLSILLAIILGISSVVTRQSYVLEDLVFFEKSKKYDIPDKVIVY